MTKPDGLCKRATPCCSPAASLDCDDTPHWLQCPTLFSVSPQHGNTDALSCKHRSRPQEPRVNWHYNLVLLIVFLDITGNIPNQVREYFLLEFMLYDLFFIIIYFLWICSTSQENHSNVWPGLFHVANILCEGRFRLEYTIDKSPICSSRLHLFKNSDIVKEHYK